jgi:hypothetical protein
MAETAQFTIGTGVSCSDGIQLTISKYQVEDLPSVDIDHPDLTAHSTTMED